MVYLILRIWFRDKEKVNGLVNKRRTKLVLNEAYDFVATGDKPSLKTYI